MKPTNQYIEEFEKLILYDKGLFNNESGWRVRADPKKLKEFIRYALTQREREVADALMLEEKPDLDLEPGFNVTAEYRLGEIRGYNQANKDLKAKRAALLADNN